MAFFLIFRDFGRIWGEEKRRILTTVKYILLFYSKLGPAFEIIVYRDNFKFGNYMLYIIYFTQCPWRRGVQKLSRVVIVTLESLRQCIFYVCNDRESFELCTQGKSHLLGHDDLSGEHGRQ